MVDGDNLFQLARSYYNDGSLWPVIRNANPSLEEGNEDLIVGDKLIIPGRDHPVFLEYTLPIGFTEPIKKRLPVVHEVRPGDTLFKLSFLYYGTGTHHDRIQEANPDIADDPSKIGVGQKLVIPQLDEDKAGQIATPLQ